MASELASTNIQSRILQLEKELHDREQEVILLKEAGDATSSEHRLDAVLEMVAQRARKLVHAETLFIPILDTDSNQYTYKAGFGLHADEIVGESLPMNFGICGWVWKHKRAWWKGIFDELSEEDREKWKRDGGHVMLVPLQGKRHFLGGIAAHNKEGGGDFDERDLYLLSMFAGQVSIAIENAMFYEDIQAAKSESEIYQKQLENLNHELEERVDERTQEMNLALTELRQVADDLAREKNAQQKLIMRLENQDVLRETNKKLEAATKSKSAFLANMSHEIRTPLTAIIGFGESLLDSDSTMSDRIESIHSIISNGTHLQQIINDILDISKIEADKLEIELIKVPLFELVTDIESLIKVQASERGLKTSIDFKFPLPQHIYSDPVRLKQILINLCNNAIKFTEKGHVSLEISCDPILQNIEFDIIDTGIGLSPEEQGRIFDIFTQADSSTTRRFGGTGLGLPLSRQLAEMLGGKLTVTSKTNVGSRFSVIINAGDLDTEQFVNEAIITNVSLKQDNEHNDRNFLSGHILLAEDTPDNQRLISMYIRKTGADVTVVDNGEQALKRALSQNFDLVLMDMQMPIMDGMEAVQALREQGYSKPIVALTANVMKEDRERCAQAGCDDFASKPINRKLFLDILKRYLPSQSVESSNHSPIISTLIEDDPEYCQLVEKFIQHLPDSMKKINDAQQQSQWPELKALIHELKGLGGGMGFSILTETAQTIEFQLAKQNYREVTSSIIELNALCERVYLGNEANP